MGSNLLDQYLIVSFQNFLKVNCLQCRPTHHFKVSMIMHQVYHMTYCTPYNFYEYIVICLFFPFLLILASILFILLNCICEVCLKISHVFMLKNTNVCAFTCQLNYIEKHRFSLPLEKNESISTCVFVNITGWLSIC